MFLLVNTFIGAVPGPCAGTVISKHDSLEAAQAAERRLQRAIRRRSPVSYMPTEVIQVTHSPGSAWVTHEYLAAARVAAAVE